MSEASVKRAGGGGGGRDDDALVPLEVGFIGGEGGWMLCCIVLRCVHVMSMLHDADCDASVC